MSEERTPGRPGSSETLPITHRGGAVLLFVGGLLVSLVLAELTIRFWVPAPLYRRPPQVRYDPHPIRAFELRPCQRDVYTLSAPVTVDCAGFRTNGEQSAADRALLVLALGDSFVFGMGVADGETLPARLEYHLNARLREGARVINGGTISYGVFQELDFLREQLPKLRPRIVVHGIYWNDYQSAHLPGIDDPPILTPEGYFVWDAEPRTNHPFAGARAWIFGHSSLLNTIRVAVRRLEPHGDDTSGYRREYARLLEDEIDSEAWNPIQDFYEELRTLQQQYDFELFAVIFPVVDLVGPEMPEHSYHPRIASLLDRMQVPYLDGFTLWKEARHGRETFLPQGRDAHLNARGYEAIARELAPRLIEANSANSN